MQTAQHHAKIVQTLVLRESQMLVKLPEALVKRFKKQLIEDDLTFKTWIKARIQEYLRDS